MEIKPCPHCGGTAWLTQNYNRTTSAYFVLVKCDVCGAQGKIYNSPEEPAATCWINEACMAAVRAWNMRKGEENAQKSKDRL